MTTVHSENPESPHILFMDEKNQRLLKIIEKDRKIKMHFHSAIFKNHPEMSMKRGIRLNDIHMCDIRTAKIILKTLNKFSEF